MSYSAIELALDGIYNEIHRPEALGKTIDDFLLSTQRRHLPLSYKN